MKAALMTCEEGPQRAGVEEYVTVDKVSKDMVIGLSEEASIPGR